MHHIIKNIIKNPRMIVSYIYSTGLFNWVSDEKIIKLLWWVHYGTKLDVKHPNTFNEKIQWLKLNNRSSKMTMMVDKYEVRKYISSLIGEQYLIPLIGVWDKPEDIDFDILPNQFVLKCNHNAAVGLCICRDKSTINKNKVIKGLKKGLSKNFYYTSREYAYKHVSKKVICEKYMCDNDHGYGLRDYKFFCFNGVAKFLYISEGLENHDTARIAFYDLKGNEMPFHRKDYNTFSNKIRLPENFQELVDVANIISSDICFPFVRIDLYSINNKVYFSEITFYPNSGFIPFEPAEYDLILGKMIDLSLINGD